MFIDASDAVIVSLLTITPISIVLAIKSSDLRLILREEGYRVEVAEDGIDALIPLGRNKYDLLLLDINMPKMDGINCIEEIVNSDPQARISIISGYELNIADELSERTRNNVKGYLVKPVALPELSTLLEEMLKD